jgi:hypothetical protein
MKFGFVGWFPAPVAFLDHEMISRLKTPVAVLRQMLSLSVEDFGKLIGKSLSTVTKLDNGALPLSEPFRQPTKRAARDDRPALSAPRALSFP